MKINKRVIPFIIILTTIAIPIIFLISLNNFFNILDYSNPSKKDFNKLLDFAKLIIENIGKRKLKSEIWASFFYSLIPLMILIAILSNVSKFTSHGKARWASDKDIEDYRFSLKKLLKDYLNLINPKNLISFKRFKKTVKECLMFGLIKINPIRMNFNKGVILGEYVGFFKKRKVYYDEPLSTFVVAPPGSGKSAGVIIPNLLQLKTSCIVTDIKGELCDLTAGYRQKILKNQIYIFNPLGDDNNIKFNPFDKRIIEKLNFNQRKRLIYEIANTIFVEENKNTDSHWIQSAKNLFIFYAIYDISTKGEANFFDIANGVKRDYIKLIDDRYPHKKDLYQLDKRGDILVDDEGNRKINLDSNPERIWYMQVADQKYTDPSLEENFIEENSEEIENNLKNKNYKLLDEIVRNEARRLTNINENEFASIKSTFDRVMTIFSDYQVKEATSGMSFEYDDLRKENITIYIKVAQNDIDTLSPLIRIFLESISKNLMTKESKNPNERIYFLLDEFIRFGKMPFITDMPALCRSYNLIPIYITQDFAMVEKYYSKEDLRIMNGNIAYRILFRMNDYESAEAVSKEVGNYTRTNRNISTTNKNFLETSSSISKEGVSLISAQDILNLKDDEVVITSTGNKAKPIKLKAYFYYKKQEELSKLKHKFNPHIEEKIINE